MNICDASAVHRLMSAQGTLEIIDMNSTAAPSDCESISSHNTSDNRHYRLYCAQHRPPLASSATPSEACKHEYHTRANLRPRVSTHQAIFSDSLVSEDCRLSSSSFPSASSRLPSNAYTVLLCILILLGSMCRAQSQETIMSSRLVTLKYGTIRGMIVNLANPNLQPVEVFLGK